MKKQKVSLKKLSLSKSKVATLGTNRIVGGGTIVCITEGNECKPKKSVYPDICPATDGCPPQTAGCQTIDCYSIFCQSIFCQTVVGCF